MNKLNSKKTNEEKIDSIINNEQAKKQKLLTENKKIKEKNMNIQNKLFQYLNEDSISYKESTVEDINKYNELLSTVIEYMNKLKLVNKVIATETCNLIAEFFECIKEVIIKQHNYSYLMKEDMIHFKILGQDELFKKNLLSLRKVCEHNSVLRAQINLLNEFKLKDENLIHADFEQLEEKYKNLKTKESALEQKILNLYKKIKKSIEKKLHLDERNIYLQKIVEDKVITLEDSHNAITNKKKLLMELKNKKEESIRKYNDLETNSLTKNLAKLQEEYNSLSQLEMKE
ncbi:conserved protein, unknown function [Hepatocystis sp. ex Piliocolobus tephrosceles]|nr:conserved protein, unknown function [Hepatocystis sp. ex Piliocolobus tephrosceles]